MSELRDRTIIVTGAAGAIGTVTCHQLAAAGARLVLVDLSKERLQALAGELPGTGHRIQASALESPAACRSVVRGIEGPIYGLVHLAGIFVAHDLTPAARRPRRLRPHHGGQRHQRLRPGLRPHRPPRHR